MSSEPPKPPEHNPPASDLPDETGGDRPEMPTVGDANRNENGDERESILSSSTATPISQTTQNAAQRLWSQVQPPLTSVTVAGLGVALNGIDWAIRRLEPVGSAPSTGQTQPPVDAAMPNVEQGAEAPPTPAAPPPQPQGIWGQVQPVLASIGLLLLIILGQGFGGLRQQLDPNAAVPPAIAAAAAENPAWKRIAPILQQIWQRWTGVLAFVRDRLPPSLRQLSNTAMTTLTIGILAILFWITSSLGSAPAAETATNRLPVSTAEDAPVAVVSSDDLEAAEPAALTPEQELVASLQEQVAELSAQYADGLIQSVRVNFLSDRLTVTVEPTWDDLPADRQRQLAGEMLERAQSLDFQSLEILDTAGDRVARSPVVGSEMVFFR